MRILVPVDQSQSSKNCVKFICQRPMLTQGSNVEMVTVVPALPVTVARYLDTDQIQMYINDEAEAVFKEVEKIVDAHELQPTMSTLIGDPIEAIVKRIKTHNPHLVVMGARGNRNLASILFGSVSRGVMANTQVPLLLIRDDVPPKDQPLKIGIAVDGSAYGQQAVNFAVTHHEFFGPDATFELIHVVDDLRTKVIDHMYEKTLKEDSPEFYMDVYAEPYKEATADARAEFDRASLAFKPVCLAGDASDKIAQYVKQADLDLLIMGSHGKTNMKELILGSVARKITAKTTVPLILIR